MSQICRELLKLVANLRRCYFPFDEESIPLNGIYILFEKGETAHGTDRIVRVGTHTGDDNLSARLWEHFIVENKDRSIFRKHIGRAILVRDKDPFRDQWEWDLTSTKNKKKYSSKLDWNKQKQTEMLVTKYIQKNLSFVVLPVMSKQQRLDLEGRLIGEVSRCEECGPSALWLGKHAPARRIRQSGLWQIQKVFGNPLTPKSFENLKHIIASVE